MLGEAENDEEALNRYFHDRFPDKASAEEYAERNQEMSAEEAGQIE